MSIEQFWHQRVAETNEKHRYHRQQQINPEEAVALLSICNNNDNIKCNVAALIR